MVEIVTQWPGHAAEEVERLITVPIELEMNGLPGAQGDALDLAVRIVRCHAHLRAMATDNYFARQQVFERLPDVESARRRDAVGVAALLAVRTRLPLRAGESGPLGDGAQDHSGLGARAAVQVGARRGRHVVARRRDDAVSGADRSDRGSPAPASRVPQVATALAANNGNAGGGFYSEGGQFYYVRGLGRLETLEDIGNVVARGAQRHAGAGEGRRRGRDRRTRRGSDSSASTTANDAVEGVILMRTGEQAQTVLKGVQAKTQELNDSILPKDVKVRPFYDRSDLIALTTRTVEDNLLRGIVLVVVDPDLLPVRRPLGADRRGRRFRCRCCSRSSVSTCKHIPANLLSIGAIDFGILVDGAVVMVENIYRQLALHHGTELQPARRDRRGGGGGRPADLSTRWR